MASPDDVDIALAAYREEGVWQLQELADPVLTSLDAVISGLRRFPGDGGAIGLLALDEDVFLVVRVAGPQVRLLLSDVTAADIYDLAREVIEHLGLPYPEEDDEPAPAGDLAILSDLGVRAGDMGELIDDFDLYPDEMLSDIADRLGFGDDFDDLVGLTNA
ncbi:tRNA adenosine deaminase-associated protein [Nocardioides jiangxiensis]|uniref:tRNA adenosine deaminase-associated protein n=1 Tax=Nocardioides jiangxiensis TaxID=3064524 RepID=A0ABT9B141_9ACTN|nr:tRNA adenosine deaminase-associated protein [Nocardioides sp. WY-20]MDO7868034.1 tRNA adenosine deaminase-associated protein [Nocardioides sp. WY-20]